MNLKKKQSYIFINVLTTINFDYTVHDEVLYFFFTKLIIDLKIELMSYNKATYQKSSANHDFAAKPLHFRMTTTTQC